MTASPNWRKSSYSVANSACVEVAIIKSGTDSAAVAVRDSKSPDGAILTYRPEAWRWFIDDIRADQIRRP